MADDLIGSQLIGTADDLWRHIADSLEVAVCAVDGDLRVTACNRPWDVLAAQAGRDDLLSSQLIGRPLLSTMDEDDRRRWSSICARLLDGEELSYWTETYWPTVAERRPWTLTARTLFGGEGETLGIAFSLADALERRRLEDALARYRLELRGLYEVAQSVGMIRNEAELFKRITGHLGYLFGARLCVIALRDEASDRLVTRTPAHGLTPAEAQQFELPAGLYAEALATFQNNAASYRLINRLRDYSAEGQALAERWQAGSLLYAPLRNHGRWLGILALIDAADKFTDDEGRLLATFAGLVAAAVDASQLVLALEDRAGKLSAALSEIQELDRLRDGLIQNVSHELRLPLMVIQGYADLLKDGAFGELAPELQQAADVISGKTRQLAKRVDDISLLRGLQQTDLQLSEISLAALVRSAVERARPQAQQAGVQIVEDIMPETRPLQADYRRLEQVIDELLDNAVKFSPDGGRVHVTLREGAEVVYLKVSDEGIGIPPTEIPRIWDRFYQSDASTTRRFSGTGVGLAVVKQIVEAHGGQVWVESEAGRGSQFYVALNRGRADAAGPHGWGEVL